MTWFAAHVPFTMSFVLSASSLGVLVRAHDAPNTPLASLYPTFVARSEDHITPALAWFYCGGLGVSLGCLTVIAFTHTHRRIPNQRLGKHTRLLFRFAVAVVILCLPLAHLNSVGLVASTTGLVLGVLLLELVGGTCWGESFWWERNCGRDKCSYSAKCGVRREELEKSLKEGTVLDVEEIARRDGGEKGGLGTV
jgi:hypothetical protein